MKKIVLLTFVLVFLSLQVFFGNCSREAYPRPYDVNWSEEAANYRDNYLYCVQSKTGMPMAYVPEACALMICSSEKLANRTDYMVDLIDVRAVQVTFMIDKGYFPGTYADGCAAVSGWEMACNVPYPIDCSEVVDFIDTYHDDIAAAIAVCEGAPPPPPPARETVTYEFYCTGNVSGGPSWGGYVNAPAPDHPDYDASYQPPGFTFSFSIPYFKVDNITEIPHPYTPGAPTGILYKDNCTGNSNGIITVSITNNLGCDITIIDLTAEVTDSTMTLPFWHMFAAKTFANFSMLGVDPLEPYVDEVLQGYLEAPPRAPSNDLDEHYKNWTGATGWIPGKYSDVYGPTSLRQVSDANGVDDPTIPKGDTTLLPPEPLAAGETYTEYFGAFWCGNATQGANIYGTITLTLTYEYVQVTWSEDAAVYRDNYLFCILKKTGMPPGPIPKAAALTECASEKLANRTDGSVDLIDLRAVEVTFMIDAGYFVGTYADGCAALSGWEMACNVPYAINCPEILDFIETNHEDIVAAFDACGKTLPPPPPPLYTLTIYSSPLGVEFTVDGLSRTTPWSGTYSEDASVSLMMPSIHNVVDAIYCWDQWSDGNTSRSRRVSINTNITLTAHYTGPYYVTWSNDAINYRLNYLDCIFKQMGVPYAFISSAIEFTAKGAESLAALTDGVVDVQDIRQFMAEYMVEIGAVPTLDAAYEAIAECEAACVRMSSDFPVTLEGEEYHVTTFSNSTISVFQFDEVNRIINFNAGGEEGIGFCRVCIPYDLVSPTYTVIIDDGHTEVLHFNDNLYDNGTHRWIYFTYQHSTHKVEIIPEFPTWASMLLILIVLTVAIAVYKRRLLKTPTH